MLVCADEGKPKKKQKSKLSVVKMLHKKFKRKTALKEELEMKRVELELQKRKLDQEDED